MWWCRWMSEKNSWMRSKCWLYEFPGKLSLWVLAWIFRWRWEILLWYWRMFCNKLESWHGKNYSRKWMYSISYATRFDSFNLLQWTRQGSAKFCVSQWNEADSCVKEHILANVQKVTNRQIIQVNQKHRDQKVAKTSMNASYTQVTAIKIHSV